MHFYDHQISWELSSAFRIYLNFDLMSSVLGGLINGGATNMRGLNEFISDIRECKDKESETKRVELELSKIRERFTTEKGLNAYQRKKYVWKLLYIHILGYEVDFGFQEASGLINSAKYDEKYTGYIATSLIIPESNDEVWKTIIYSVESDIRSRNEAAQSLALSMLATIMPQSLASLSDAIFDLALSSRTSLPVRKKALVCLARMIRKDPNKYDLKKVFAPLSDIFEAKNSGSLSLLSGGASLLLSALGSVNPDQLKDIQPKIVRLLHRLAINKQCPMNYLYYTHPNPWLQMKLYKALQVWSPPEERGILDLVEEVLTKVLKRTDASQVLNKSNIEYGLLFEVINVIIHYNQALDKKLTVNVSKILVVFISSSRANIRYLGLQAMCRLAVRHNLAEHLDKILINLDHTDVSIRKRALDLLYLICNSNNVSTIVAELLGYLENRVDPHIHDDLVLKIAILAQKFAENLIWYVDVVVKLIQNAEVQNDIWYRIIQIITGFGQANPDLQNYAAVRLLSALNLPHVTDTLVCVGSYVVSEFSEYLVKAGRDPRRIFEAINKHFSSASNKARAMMLNALSKLAVKYEPLREEVQMICHLCTEHWDPDVQQRGVQFLALFAQDVATQNRVVTTNPAYTEEQQQANPLLKKFAKGGKRGKEMETAASTVKSSTVKSTAPPPQASGFQTVTNSSNVTSHPLSNHPCFKLAIDRLSPNLVNLLDQPGKLELKPYWKEALVKKTPFEGCEIREKLEDGVLKVILSIAVNTTEMQFKVFRNKGFQVTNSPVKYAGDSQQILLTFAPNGEKMQPPSVGIAWKDGQGQISKREVQLPITVNKFLNPVELTYEKFNTFYKDYSLANQKFFKLDSFQRLPEGVKAPDYLKKVGSFLSSVCNFKCSAHPSPAEMRILYGSATFPLKEEGKLANYPLLIECEGYEAEKGGAVRVCLRGGNGNSLLSVYQLFIAFF